MIPNPERRNPHRLARDAERQQQVAASLARIAEEVATTVTAEQFEQLFGRAPQQDDLERVNCQHVGEAGHYACGRCERHGGRPRFECLCGVNGQNTMRDQQEVADALESEGAAGIARDAATDELEALDLEGMSMLMHDFIRPMGVQS